MGLTKIYIGFYKHFSVIYFDKFRTTRQHPPTISTNLSATLSTSIELDMVADMEVDKVADMAAEMFKTKCMKPEMV